MGFSCAPGCPVKRGFSAALPAPGWEFAGPPAAAPPAAEAAPHEIKIKVQVQGRVDRVGGGAQQQRIAVGRRTNDRWSEDKAFAG